MALMRIALAVSTAVVALLVGAAPAFAHARLESSDPAEGASLSAAPPQVTLTFAEAVTVPEAPISVTGPDGASWTVGAATVAGAVVATPVEATGPAGRYTLRYTVISDDGDRVEGAVRFTLTAAATPAAAAAGTAQAQAEAAPATAAAVGAAAAAPTVVAAPVEAAGSSGTSVGVWVAVAVVVIGVLAGLAVARSRRGSAGRTP